MSYAIKDDAERLENMQGFYLQNPVWRRAATRSKPIQNVQPVKAMTAFHNAGALW